MVQSAGEFLATDVVLAGIAVIAVIAFIFRTGSARASAPSDAPAWRSTMSERLSITRWGRILAHKFPVRIWRVR